MSPQDPAAKPECAGCAKAALALSLASWAAFVLAAVMLRAPSPLLLALVPAHVLLGLAALAVGAAPRWARALTALLLALTFAFLFKQTFLR